MKLATVPKVFTTAELDKLLGTFPKNAAIERFESVAVVRNPRGEKVLSAAEVAESQWHVMAVPGLLQPVPKKGN